MACATHTHTPNTNPQVLRRSGTTREQRYSAGILPLVRHQHFLLVTLLLCNAVAMTALPLFIDRLADPVTAIVISVTAVLVFGEILPQALCSRCAGGGSRTARMNTSGVGVWGEGGRESTSCWRRSCAACSRCAGVLMYVGKQPAALGGRDRSSGNQPRAT